MLDPSPAFAPDRSYAPPRPARSPSWRSILSTNERIVITGMAINTPLGDTLEAFLAGLLQGRSALSRWHGIDVSRCYSKIGADLSGYDTAAKLASLEGRVDPEAW